jgi:hypothetical protein
MQFAKKDASSAADVAADENVKFPNSGAGEFSNERREPPKIRDAEARRRQPQIGLQNVSDFRPCRNEKNAEKFARNILGIGEAHYGGILEIANLCNRAILSLKRRGMPVPREIRVTVAEFGSQEQNVLATYDPGLLDNPGIIFINPDNEAWTDGGVRLRKAGADKVLSTGDRHHPIIHEMGELAMHQSVPDRFALLSPEWIADEKEFRRSKQGVLSDLSNVVSVRAGQNHSEFVAEVLTALMLGRDDLKQNRALMEQYTRFGGERIRSYEV